MIIIIVLVKSETNPKVNIEKVRKYSLQKYITVNYPLY